MKPYVVKQGDYLNKLAHRLCFDADEVWNDPANAELKDQRGKGDILKPGDILFVPDEPPKTNPFTAESSNEYVAKVPTITVELILEQGGEPLADEPYRVEGIGDDEQKQADGEGTVSFEVPVHVREVLLELVERGQKMRVCVGELDPVSDASGARMRLTNLGYCPKSFAGADQYEAHDDGLLHAALRSFQAAQGLESTGELDDATQQALLDAHGS
jgi:hypothetical protein